MSTVRLESTATLCSMTLRSLTKACFLLCVATEFAGLSVKARVLAFINHLHRSRVTSADNTVVLKELALGECVVSIATTCSTTLTSVLVLYSPRACASDGNTMLRAAVEVVVLDSDVDECA